MQDLLLSEKDDIGTNILKIIEFVKQVEREQGLSEDEINYKYACKFSNVLASMVKETIARLFGKTNKVVEDCINIKTRNGIFDLYHSYIKYIDYANGKFEFFNIFGQRTFEQLEEFVEDWRDDKIEWLKQTRREILPSTAKFIEFKHVVNACREHITTDGTTVNV